MKDDLLFFTHTDTDKDRENPATMRLYLDLTYRCDHWEPDRYGRWKIENGKFMWNNSDRQEFFPLIGQGDLGKRIQAEYEMAKILQQE